MLNGSGFVGTVTQVSEDTSTVLLADDASSVIGVQLPGQRPDRRCHRDGQVHVRVPDAPAHLVRREHRGQPGQQVDTYASVGDQPEVPGVPVGTIVSVHSSPGALTQTALVRPFVNFTALGVVGIVIQVPRHNPRTSILPHPAPTVTVTVTPSPSSSASVAPGTLPASSGGASATPSATGGTG